MNVGKRGPLVGIVNYHMGNLGSVACALECLGARHVVSGKADDLAKADALILPGVGAFGAAMDILRQSGLVEFLSRRVMEEKTPFLGICLGMQLLATDSTELGFHQGLGWLQESHVVDMVPTPSTRIPHVGWNTLDIRQPLPLFTGIDATAHFYFDHGFHLLCPSAQASALSTHGAPFVAALARDNLLAVQFHPEKSQRHGLRLLRNFLNFAGGH